MEACLQALMGFSFADYHWTTIFGWLVIGPIVFWANQNIKKMFAKRGWDQHFNQMLAAAPLANASLTWRDRLSVGLGLVFLEVCVLSIYAVGLFSADTTFIGFMAIGITSPLLLAYVAHSLYLRGFIFGGTRLDQFLGGVLLGWMASAYDLVLAWALNRIIILLVAVHVLH